jgi:hypothetical protein
VVPNLLVPASVSHDVPAAKGFVYAALDKHLLIVNPTDKKVAAVIVQ